MPGRRVARRDEPVENCQKLTGEFPLDSAPVPEQTYLYRAAASAAPFWWPADGFSILTGLVQQLPYPPGTNSYSPVSRRKGGTTGTAKPSRLAVLNLLRV